MNVIRILACSYGLLILAWGGYLELYEHKWLHNPDIDVESALYQDKYEHYEDMAFNLFGFFILVGWLPFLLYAVVETIHLYQRRVRPACSAMRALSEGIVTPLPSGMDMFRAGAGVVFCGWSILLILAIPTHFFGGGALWLGPLFHFCTFYVAAPLAILYPLVECAHWVRHRRHTHTTQ